MIKVRLQHALVTSTGCLALPAAQKIPQAPLLADVVGVPFVAYLLKYGDGNKHVCFGRIPSLNHFCKPLFIHQRALVMKFFLVHGPEIEALSILSAPLGYTMADVVFQKVFRVSKANLPGTVQSTRRWYKLRLGVRSC